MLHVQVRDKWSFQQTGRHEMYASLLARYIRPDFKPQVIADACLGESSQT